MKMPKWIGLAVLPFAFSSCFIVVVESGPRIANLKAQATYCAAGEGRNASGVIGTGNNTLVDFKFDVIEGPVSYEVYWAGSTYSNPLNDPNHFPPVQQGPTLISSGRHTAYVTLTNDGTSIIVGQSIVVDPVNPPKGRIFVRVKKSDGSFGPWLQSNEITSAVNTAAASCDPGQEAVQ